MRISSLTAFLMLLLLSLFGFAGAGDIEPGSPAKLNLVVHYDYEEESPEKIKPLLQEASRRLFEATEGQLEIGKVSIYVKCPANRPEADIIVNEKIDGTASATVSGFGVRGAHINIFQQHVLTPTAAADTDGSTTIVHELGHFVFGLLDEYQGQTVYTKLDSGIPAVPVPAGVVDPSSIAEHPSLFFCTGEDGLGSACIMNSGYDKNIGKAEFCTATHHTRHNKGVATSVTTKFFQDGEFGNYHLTDQHATYYRDCWKVIQESLENKGVSVTLPAQGAQSTSGSPSTIEVEVLKCAPAVALVLDCSGSMSGSRLASMKSSAEQVVGILEDGNKLSITAYSSDALVIFPMQALDSGNRATALAAIQSLSADGNTNIGGGILSGLGQLMLQTERPEPGIIVLLTDGEHNTGTDPTVAAAQVAGAKFKLQSIALGSSFDAGQLKTASEQTGGTLVVVEDDKDLASAIVQQATAVQGDDVLLSERAQLSPGATIDIEIPIDQFVQRFSAAVSWDLGTLTAVLLDPNGQTVTGAVQQTNNSKVISIAQPARGTYKLRLTADQGNSLDSNYSLQVLTRSESLSFAARAYRTGGFPAPIKIEAHPNAFGSPVTGASVRAIVRDPQGNFHQIDLFDDGSTGHGDLKAGDGSYSNLFQRFDGSGDYEIRILVSNVDGKTSSGVEYIPDFIPVPVPPFRRELRTSVTVDDFQTLATADLQFKSDLPQLPEYSIDTFSSELYQLRFGVTTGSGEPVKVRSFRFSSSGSGNEKNVKARLYIDSDKDGFIDTDGPTMKPVATGTFDADNGVLELGDGVVLEPDREVHFILTYKVDLSELLIVQAGLPLLLLLLALPLTLNRQKRPMVLAALTCFVAVTIVGCGSNQDSFVFTDAGTETGTLTGPIPISPQSFTSRLVGISVEGAVTGNPVKVTDFQELQGNTATIE